jgi:hypothetical protein
MLVDCLLLLVCFGSRFILLTSLGVPEIVSSRSSLLILRSIFAFSPSTTLSLLMVTTLWIVEEAQVFSRARVRWDFFSWGALDSAGLITFARISLFSGASWMEGAFSGIRTILVVFVPTGLWEALTSTLTAMVI